MMYFDQSATSLHKPPEVTEAVLRALTGGYGNPARGAHQAANQALKALARARRSLAAYFGVNPLDIAFAANATMALNQAIKGALGAGDRVLTTGLAHNAMLRPLYQMQARGMGLDLLPLGPDGGYTIMDLKQALRPDTSALCINAMSNVSGFTAPLPEIAALCVERDLLLILDLSQYAGTRALPQVPRWPRSLMAFTGHKSLYGPQGVGGLIKRGDIPLAPLLSGGSGVHSFLKEQPATYPEVCEAGTLNLPGILGLQAGVDWLMQQGQAAVSARLSALRQLFVAGLKQIPGVDIYDGGADPGPVVALNMGGMDAAEVSRILDEDHGIMTRAGAHCAPLWHQAMGTERRGAVRFSFSLFNTEDEVDRALFALKAIAGS